MSQCVAVCCSVLRCVAVCWSVVSALFDALLYDLTHSCILLQCVVVCCSVLHCVAVCCSVLQRVVAPCNVVFAMFGAHTLRDMTQSYVV